MKIILFSISACVAMAIASTGQAQISTGTNTRARTASPVYAEGNMPVGTMENKLSATALRAGRKMAACAGRSRPKAVAEVLSSTDAGRFKAAMIKLRGALAPCLVDAVGSDVGQSEIKFSQLDLIGLLSEAALTGSAGPVFQRAPIASVPRAPTWMASNEGQSVMLQVATCLAHTRPEQAQSVLSSEPDSAQEGKAFGALALIMSSCVDKNMTLKASKSGLRLALATATYRRKFIPSLIPAAAPALDGK